MTGYHHHAVAAIKRRLPGVSAGMFAPGNEPRMPPRAYRQIVEHYAAFRDFDVGHASLPDPRLLDVGRLPAVGQLVHASDMKGVDERLGTVDLGFDNRTTNHPAEALAAFTGR